MEATLPNQDLKQDLHQVLQRLINEKQRVKKLEQQLYLATNEQPVAPKIMPPQPIQAVPTQQISTGHEQEIESLKKCVEDLSQKINEVRTKEEVCQPNIQTKDPSIGSKLRQELFLAQSDLRDAKEKILTLEEEIRRLRNFRHTIQSKVQKEREQERTQNEEQILNLKKESEKTIQGLTDQNSKLSEQKDELLTALHQKETELNTQRSELTERVTLLEHHLARRVKECSALTKTNDEQTIQIAELKNKISHLESAQHDLLSTLQEKERELLHLKQIKIQEINEKESVIQAALREKNQLVMDLNRAAQEVKRLRVVEEKFNQMGHLLEQFDHVLSNKTAKSQAFDSQPEAQRLSSKYLQDTLFQSEPRDKSHIKNDLFE